MTAQKDELEFIPEFKPSGVIKNGYYFVFLQDKILIEKGEPSWHPLDLEQWQRLELESVAEHHFGTLFNLPCIAIELNPACELPPDYDLATLRDIAWQIDRARFAIVGRALQIVEWDRTHQFCGKCGQKTKPHTEECSRICDPCSLRFYPKLSPAIIVLVTRGEELLLARGPLMPEDFYSTLAGFVEAGESVEECVHREVMEEVGVRIKNLKYYNSQAWPFPNSLMLGYHAEYESGEFVLQADEIADAQWFHYSNLPKRPQKVSISSWLIDDFVQRITKILS